MASETMIIDTIYVTGTIKVTFTVGTIKSEWPIMQIQVIQSCFVQLIPGQCLILVINRLT